MDWAQSKKQLQNGRYTVQEVIGVGRFGITYRAVTEDDEWIVIKTLNSGSLQSPERDRLQQVFVKEAFKLAKCQHPHIVKAYEPFQEDGLWCIPMEYIAGMPLSKRDCRVVEETEALEYIRQIGEALQVVHANGLVHRDVCPANILLRVRNGQPEVVLIDFGLARTVDFELTQKRTEEISVGFSPIELYTTEAKPGTYTDIYALGATLYDLLMGITPPSAEFRRVDGKKLIFSQNITQRTQKAIKWAMEIDAQERPQSMHEWLEALNAFSKTPEPKSFQMNWRLVGAAIAALVAVASGLATVVSGWADLCGTVDRSWLCPSHSIPAPPSTPGTTP